MRELKFRFWDTYEKKMIYHGYEHADCYFHGLLVCEGDTIPLQFTGLKDKNDREIYEMDILIVEWGNMKEPYIVDNKYDKPFIMEWRHYQYPPFSRYLPMPKDIEVLGNWYENPELMS